MITTILILAYCVVGAIFTWGITKEWQNDKSGELNYFSPVFVKVCIVGASLIWPVLLVIAAYKIFKEKK